MGIKSVCIVGGLGRMGSLHVKRMEQEHPNIEVSIKDDSDTAYWQYPDADAYIIATPSDTHYEIAKDLLSKGKHVLCEKPLTMKYLEAMELAKIAEENNATLLCSHTQRYNPAFTNLQEQLKESAYLEFEICSPQQDIPGNLIFDLMIHELELALYLLDSASLGTLVRVHLEEDSITAVLVLEGKLCHFYVSYRSNEVVRTINSDKAYCDLLTPSISGQDALYYLHNRFLELASKGETPRDIRHTIAAVGIAEMLQRKLF